MPAGLEMLDQAAARRVEPFVKAGYDLDAAAILLCESDGTPEEVEAEILQMLRVLEGARATRLQVSADETERQRFWAGRKNAFPAAGRAWKAAWRDSNAAASMSLAPSAPGWNCSFLVGSPAQEAGHSVTAAQAASAAVTNEPMIRLMSLLLPRPPRFLRRRTIPA